MSIKNVASFCEAIGKDPELQAEVQQSYHDAGEKGFIAFKDEFIPSELVAIAARHGHEFTEQELGEAWGQVSGLELSDEELADCRGDSRLTCHPSSWISGSGSTLRSFRREQSICLSTSLATLLPLPQGQRGAAMDDEFWKLNR